MQIPVLLLIAGDKEPVCPGDPSMAMARMIGHSGHHTI
jgi:hypothetical protein